MKTGIRIDGKYVIKRGNQYYLTDISDKDILNDKKDSDLKKYKKKVTMKVKRLMKVNKIKDGENVNFSKRSKKKIMKKGGRM
jgi:hypothetical protein